MFKQAAASWAARRSPWGTARSSEFDFDVGPWNMEREATVHHHVLCLPEAGRTCASLWWPGYGLLE